MSQTTRPPGGAARRETKSSQGVHGRCELCDHRLTVWDTCDSCDLYNAAIAAQKAAACAIALSFDDGATEAWLNEHGVFAWVDGVTLQVGTPEQAAPFVALTGHAMKITTFWRDRKVTK